MPDTDWQRVRSLFDGALDQPPTERTAWLDHACGGDRDLRARVDRLLHADEGGTTAAIEAAPPARLLAAADIGGIVGQRIGRYTVRGVLGVGGMSTVFEAQQDQPKRVVALKTMRFGFASDSARRRFALESEILGRLKHPAIAEVYEAGTWREPLAGGEMPFFAMELIAGARPLDRYVREAKLGLRATLELFAQVCDGVAHGHLVGIVHRDLKPANILVDGAGRPRIIDFGIARATEADLGGKTLLTETGQVIGTMQYMAPEQIEGQTSAVDERADVYALGVILYELLAGRPPFPARDHTITSFARVLRESEPPPLAHVPREISWLVRRALLPEHEARYADARALGDDVLRFVRNEPLSVGPPSTVYRLHKFLRRNRVLVAVVAALVLGIAGTSWQWLRADGALRVAQRQTTKAERVNAFLVDLIQSADPYERGGKGRGPDMTVRELLEGASARLEKLHDEPDAEADIRFNLGNALRSLGQLERAKVHHARAFELRRALHGDQHADVGEAENALALTLKGLGDIDGAERHYRSALATFRAVHGSEHRQVALALINLGSLLLSRGKRADAEPLVREAVALCERLPGVNTRFVAVGLGHLALIARERGDHAEAAACCRRALAAYASVGESEHPYAAMTREQLAAALIATGDLEGGAAELLAALASAEKSVGASSETVAGMRVRLARLRLQQRAFPAAEQEFTAAIAAWTAKSGADARITLEIRAELLATLCSADKRDEAMALGDALLADVERVFGKDDALTKRVRERLSAAR